MKPTSKLPRNIRERLSGDGRGVLFVDLRDSAGRRVRADVAVFTDATTRRAALKVAKAELARIQTEVLAGSFVSKHDRREAAKAAQAAKVEAVGPTFAEYAEIFLRDYSAHATRSCFHADRVRVLVKHFGTMRLRAITAADVDAYYRDRCKVVKSSTVLRDHAVLGKMFRQAKRWKIISTLPTEDAALPQAPGNKTRWLTREEFDGYLAAAPPWLRPMMTLAVATGMRLGEVVSLRWEDVDDPGRLLHVTPEGKTGRGRVVPLSATAKAVIDGVPKRVPRSAFIFTDSAAKPLTALRPRHRITQAARKAASRAGLDGVSFHTLRHTAASWMVQAGVPLNTVREWLGHQSFAMTLRYAHLAPDHLAGGAVALDAVLAGSVGNGEDSRQPSGIVGAVGSKVSA